MQQKTCQISISYLQFSSVQFSLVTQLCLTLCHPMNRSTPGLLSITNPQSLPKLMSIESAMPSSHLVLCHPLLLLPSIFPSIRAFSNKSALHIRWSNIGHKTIPSYTKFFSYCLFVVKYSFTPILGFDLFSVS